MAIYTPAPGASTFDATFDSTFQGPGKRIKGSQGGATFQKIGGNFAIRHRSVITNKGTVRQTHSRNRFESIQQRWKNLSALEKQSFIDQSLNYARENSLGEEYFMSGMNLQNSVNTNSFTINEAFIDTMPAPVAPPVIDLDAALFLLTSEEFFIETDPSVLPSTHSMLIYATAPMSPGTLTNQNMFVYMGVVPPSTAPNNFNFFNVYNDRWGIDQNSLGMVIHVALQFISQVTRINSLSIFGTGPVVPL